MKAGGDDGAASAAPLSDLFGNPAPAEFETFRGAPLDLFAAAAERLAYDGGRALSQEAAELAAPAPAVAVGLFAGDDPAEGCGGA